MAWTKSLAAFCVLAVLGTSQGLDLEGAKEQKCFEITKTVPADPKFVAALKTVYYPMTSRLELYRTAEDLMNGMDLTEADVYYDSCMQWKLLANGTIRSTGFNNYHKLYDTKPILPNLERFELFPQDGKGFGGKIYTTMTDNKTFFVTAICTNDGQMVWNVGSLYPTLMKETKDQILEHVTSLGFKKEYMTELRYDHCDLGDSEATTKVADSA
jgi:hypothetical protein